MSFDNYSDYMYQNDSDLRLIEIGYINAAVALLFMIIGIPWNVLVIAVILRKKMFSRPSGMLLLNMAIANLLLCLLHMPIPVVAGIERFRYDTGFNGICQAAAILMILLVLVVVYTVALMSVDRAVYLKKPLTYDNILTPQRMLGVIAILWIICIAISLLPLLGFGRVAYHTETLTCVPILHPDEEASTLHTSYFILIVVCRFFGTWCNILVAGASSTSLGIKSLLKRLRRALTCRSQTEV